MSRRNSPQARRETRQERLRAVEREYAAATVSSGLLAEKLRSDSSFLSSYGVGARDAEKFVENLEATYLIRLFAEFEAALRDVWQNHLGRETRPRAKELLDSVAAHRAVPQDCVDDAHCARRYRNFLVHEDAQATEAIDLRRAVSAMNRFLGRLPFDW